MAIVSVEGTPVEVLQTGAGRDLVLLHSLLSDRSAFDEVVPVLSRTRCLTLVNLPGYGNSAPAGPDVEDYADRIAGMMAALRLPPQSDVLRNGFGGFRRLSQANDVAQLAVFLASDAASFITGETIAIDGVFAHLKERGERAPSGRVFRSLPSPPAPPAAR